MKWKKPSNVTSYLPIASSEPDNLCSCYRAKSSPTCQRTEKSKEALHSYILLEVVPPHQSDGATVEINPTI